MPSSQVTTFHTIAPIRAPNTTWESMTSAVDDAGPDRLRHMRAEKQEGDEIEERGPDDRVLRTQHAGRHDGGDRIRRVVQPVEEIEQQRDGDQSDQQRQRELTHATFRALLTHGR